MDACSIFWRELKDVVHDCLEGTWSYKLKYFTTASWSRQMLLYEMQNCKDEKSEKINDSDLNINL